MPASPTPGHSGSERARAHQGRKAEYVRAGDVVTFTHTKVPRELEGQGIASDLIAGALADVRNQGLKIIPECPYVAGYIERHPDLQDLVMK